MTRSLGVSMDMDMDTAPQVGDTVRLTDMTEGVITCVIANNQGIPMLVIVREAHDRFHTIALDRLEPRRFDA